MNTKHYFVYLMTNKTNSVIYVGVTNNLVKRIYEHKNKFVSSFTSKYKVCKLVYYEVFDSISEALKREKQLKGGSRKKKFDLIIKQNFGFKDLYPETIG